MTDQYKAPEMSAQEIYDKVLTHLRKQGKAAVVDEDGTRSCRYRTADGLSCAVGCLLPDSLYDPVIEGLSVSSLGVTVDASQESAQRALHTILESTGLLEHTGLLHLLQGAHDTELDAQGIEAFEHEMRRIATEYGLTYTEPA